MRYDLLLLLALLGCDNPLGPEIPDNAVATEPGPSFAAWWQAVESDAEVQGDFSAVTWYKVPGEGSWLVGDVRVRGMWVKSGNRIYIAENFWDDRKIVSHEMLHVILNDPSHDHPLFSSFQYFTPKG